MNLESDGTRGAVADGARVVSRQEDGFPVQGLERLWSSVCAWREWMGQAKSQEKMVSKIQHFQFPGR